MYRQFLRQHSNLTRITFACNRIGLGVATDECIRSHWARPTKRGTDQALQQSFQSHMIKGRALAVINEAIWFRLCRRPARTGAPNEGLGQHCSCIFLDGLPRGRRVSIRPLFLCRDVLPLGVRQWLPGRALPEFHLQDFGLPVAPADRGASRRSVHHGWPGLLASLGDRWVWSYSRK